MGKAQRNRQQNAREKIAAQQAAARRGEVRKRMLLTGGSVVAVLAIVVAFVVIKAFTGTASAGSNTATANASVVSDLTGVPASTLKTVGKGSALTYNAKPIIPIPGPPLAENGKPEVLYLGAEYCPFCATERWAMAEALSRFGTFSGLKFIHSDPSDVYPSTPTLTFYKSTYTSKYVAFNPVEELTVSKQPLEAPTTAQQALQTKYQVPPYVPAADVGSIPFVDLGNKFILSGAQYNPQVLQGKTWAQVAAALKDPSNPIAQGADGAANTFTAAICKLTNNQPATACTPTVQAIEGSF
jgi:thiol-disulfide isomerase/thioredoxin